MTPRTFIIVCEDASGRVETEPGVFEINREL